MSRLAIAAAFFSLGGCDLHTAPFVAGKAREVTQVVVEEDLPAWGKLASPQLLEEMKPNDFRRVAATLRALGPLTEAELVEHAWSGGQRVTVHRLRFTEGEARLGLTYDFAGRVDALLYDGEAVVAAQARAQRDAASGFAVQRLVWLIDQETPNPRGNTFTLGETVGIGLVVSGLAASDGEHHVVIDLVVRNSLGRVIYEKAGFFEQRFPVSPQGVPRGSLYAPLRPPRPGEMDLELTIKDEAADRTIIHRAKLVVEQRL